MPQTPSQAGRAARPGTRFLVDVLAENVRMYRTRGELSQGDLAERMRVLGHPWIQSTVSDIERATRNVTVDELVALALVFRVNPTDLLNPTGIDDSDKTPVDVGAGVVPADYFAAWLGHSGAVFLEWGDRGPEGVAAFKSQPLEEED